MTPPRTLLAVSALLTLAPVPCVWADALATAPRIPTPLAVTNAPQAEYVTALALDGVTYARLSRERQVVVTGFPLDKVTRVDLALERFEVFSPDARIVMASAHGEVEMPRPDVVLLGGEVVGEPGSMVFLGLSPHGTNGVIRSAGGRHIISSGRFGTGASTVIYDLDALPEGAIDFQGFECGLDQLGGFEPHAPGAGGVAGAFPLECVEAALVAVETDWQFTSDLFEGNTAASAAYASELIAAVSEIYLRDVGVSILISNLRIWADANDLWADDNSIFDQLYEFQDYYNVNEQGIARHTAHFLSGRALSGAGGVAYLPGLCQGDWAYGLSAHLNGSFPYPLEDNHPQNWDIVVVAHELGHNFGGPHTHSMNPPVDECAYGGCANADQGTLMSYCHTCDGGIANIVLRFHERVLDEEILPYLQTGLPCILSDAAVIITQQPAGAIACVNDPVTFSVAAEGQPPLSYQWRKDGIGISGATGAEYTIVAVTDADAGMYDVVISNACGETASDVAELTVSGVTITQQPSGATVCIGDPVAFAVVATGQPPLSYQWRKNGAPLSGATGQVYSIASVTLGDAGTYDVVVFDICGPVDSSPAQLTVDDCTPPSCLWDCQTFPDGFVNVPDFLAILAQWGQVGTSCDFDGGGVGVTDFLDFLAFFGPCPP
jgi:hypothetical protein